MSSTAIAFDQEPPSKKPTREPTSNLPLPDELVLECLARVSRLYYPILSLVSKTFRSLTASPELYHTRYLSNRTEGCLYVCLQFPFEPNLRWFTLCRKPDTTLNKKRKKKKKKTSSGNVLVPVKMLNSPPVEWSDLVAVGHKLYAINREEDDVTCCSSNVFFLDCRTHAWVETPRLRLAHTKTKFDEMMYLAGSYEDPDSLNCVQVFNTETQTWQAVPEEKRIFRDTDFKGKAYKSIYSASGRSVSVMKLKDCTEDLVELGTTCLIEKILYGYLSYGLFLWSTDAKIWRKVQGLEELPRLTRYRYVNFVECGGRMVVFWDKCVPAPGGYKEQMLWCAEISLEMRRGKEVWGKVESFDAVLRVPKSYKFVYACSATV
ncbi:putative F-box/kelch-repeat protein [Raphanus sativus]|uniref:F-box/kelch-repeat protein At4g39600 n=1 Tax=Raphanus sativus TaxID=3726 RepID=A0A6J0LYW9_RAPSA|nr:putative F-box/kelch-repeat protein At4g39600 [Raphanus sativus]KAJ4905791.1 putative F-box/kelch-repeat protein [Raphanus sativus]